jgi:hypothetical protein
MLACCAFAVFLLNQLLLPLTFVRDRLWGKAASRPNDPVLWSPGAPAATATARSFTPRPALVAVLMIETLAIGGGVAAATLAARASPPSPEQRFLDALHASICHAVGRPLS